MLRPQINCNYSAVTGACLMIERNKYNKIGGFNKKYSSDLSNNIDKFYKFGE